MGGFAARFAEQEVGLRRRGDVFERASAHLARTLAEVPPPALPRVAVFGSSQVAVVKSDTVDTTRATPSRLQAALAERGLRTEVVDFSDADSSSSRAC